MCHKLQCTCMKNTSCSPCHTCYLHTYLQFILLQRIFLIADKSEVDFPARVDVQEGVKEMWLLHLKEVPHDEHDAHFIGNLRRHLQSAVRLYSTSVVVYFFS